MHVHHASLGLINVWNYSQKVINLVLGMHRLDLLPLNPVSDN